MRKIHLFYDCKKSNRKNLRPNLYAFYDRKMVYGSKGEEYMDVKECGKRIQQLRQERNLSQEQLAEKLNVSQSMIAKIECGLRRPSIDFSIELAQFFETSLNYIWLGIQVDEVEIKREIDEMLERIDRKIEQLQSKKEELLQMKKELE